MILLDWEKAFDKIDQEMMIDAIKRLNVPEEITNTIKAIYESPVFRIKDRENN